MTEINTHGMIVPFGKHSGELYTRVPVSYLKWMINEKCQNWEIAKAEFERRGDTMPLIELTGHAINNASTRVLKIWQETRKPADDKCCDDEGLYSWLQRMTLEAIAQGAQIGGKIHYKGMKFVVAEGEEFPTLKTIMRNKAND
jgi:hypothetical protein